jgi:hypothetical protein
MAFSNTYDTTNTGSAVSNREHLTDDLTIFAPEDTPILSSLPKKKASATKVEWTVDLLDSPRNEPVGEGEDVTSFADKFEGRARLDNRVQTFRRDWKVSKIQDAISSVGPANSVQAQKKCLREIKRDIELTLMDNGAKATEDGAGTKNQMSGLDTWIDSAGPSDVPASFRTPAGNIHASGTFTETVLNNMITSVYRVNGESNGLTLVADTELRRKISDFQYLGDQTSIVRNVNYDGGSGEVTLSVELYRSHHGVISIVNMNPVCAPDTTNKDYGYLLNLDYACIYELLPLMSYQLEDEGGGKRGYMDSTLTLGIKHPGAHGKITTLS